jgi:hypothetical protein
VLVAFLVPVAADNGLGPFSKELASDSKKFKPKGFALLKTSGLFTSADCTVASGVFVTDIFFPHSYPFLNVRASYRYY